jgi:acetyltransferase-like isoleucine patch superfamily enzyme
MKIDPKNLGRGVQIGENVRIIGRNIRIGDYCTISDNVTVIAPDGVDLGPCSHLGKGVSIQCWRFSAHSYLWAEDGVEIGRGGHFGSPESTVALGRGVFLGPGVVLNPNCEVTIGDEAGLGANVGVWTHGAYLPMTEGFPGKFAPVHIGSRVWLPGQSQVLPGVTVGDNAVISMMSLINRDIPAGALAGGIPVKILKENCFPRPVDLPPLLEGIVAEFLRLARWKGLEVDAEVKGPSVHLVAQAVSVFNFDTMTVVGDMGDAAEDFRDFVRRRGIRFFTGLPFKALRHPEVVRCL